MAKNEFPSVRAAAIEAGIIKGPSNLEKTQKAYEMLSEAEKEHF